MGNLNISPTAVTMECTDFIQTKKADVEKIAGGSRTDDDILKNASPIRLVYAQTGQITRYIARLI